MHTEFQSIMLCESANILFKKWPNEVPTTIHKSELSYLKNDSETRNDKRIIEEKIRHWMTNIWKKIDQADDYSNKIRRLTSGQDEDKKSATPSR